RGDRVKRRDLVLASGAGAVLAAIQASAQPARPAYRIGLATGIPYSAAKPYVEALEQGIREQGYVIGRDIVVEVHSTDGKLERLPEVIRKLVARKPDIIVASSNPVIAAAKSATGTTPIVMISSTD